MRNILFILILAPFLGANEPSAFELQSGATKKEMQNLKDKSEANFDRIFELENKIKQLEISFEGIKSIYEGQSLNINDINNKLNTINTESTANENETSKLEEQVTNNTKNVQILTESLNSLNGSIAQIKELLSELQQEIKEIQKESQEESKTAQNNSTFQKDTTKKKEIFKEARSLTYTKKFDEAIARYIWFIEIDYRKAESNYMLGNIAYEQNKYNDAIFYYKESAILDDKTKYMPRLLLNCANSLRVLGKNDDAKNFYNSLILRFPDSPEAKEAKEQLKKLKG
ncbi:MAG: tetratricopeptide repeat protein [Helicobacteraceae bacterium]|nr:tetratricopeptide repeat protein [Helicobacteraceae bacterium]